VKEAAQPAVPADRCAREIIGFLAVCVMRLRRLNGNPLGAGHHCLRSTHAVSWCTTLDNAAKETKSLAKRGSFSGAQLWL
jgi:hypothetical protein